MKTHPAQIAVLAASAAVLITAQLHADDFSWGVAVAGNWTDATKWSGGVGIPDDASDTATIAATGAAYVATLNGNYTLSGFTLNSADATFGAAGRTLTIANTASILAGTLNWQSSNWADAGATASLIFGSGANVVSTGTGSILISDFTQSSNWTIRGVLGLATSVTVSDDFTNSGTITLESTGNGNASLTLTTGTLTNSVGGTVSVRNNGGTSLARSISADFANGGSVNVSDNVTLTFGKTNGVHTNNASFNVEAGSTVNFGNDGVFAQVGGTLANDGTFQLLSDTFNFNGGTITGNAIQLASSTLNIGAGSTGAGSFVFTGGSGVLTGNVAAAQTVTILGTPGVISAAGSPTGFTNAGTLNIDSTGNGSSSFSVTTGVLTNSGTVNAQSSPGASLSRTLSSDVVNDAIFNVKDTVTLTLGKTGGVFTNNASFNVEAGSTVNFGNGGVFTQAGGTLANDGTFQLLSDTFNFNGGAVTGSTIQLASSTLNIGTGSTGAGSFTLTGGGGVLTGDIAAAQTVTIQGTTGLAAAVTSPAGFTNSGTLNIQSFSNGASAFTLTGGVMTNSGTVNVTNSAGAIATKTFTGDFANDGAFNVQNSVSLTLGKTGGVHVNNAAFNVEAGSTVQFGNGAIFTQAAGTLANGGTFQLLSDTFNFNGGAVTGSTIQLASSTLNIGTGSTGAGSFTFTGGGGVLTGDIAAAQTVSVQGVAGLAASVSSPAAFTNNGTFNIETTGNGSSAFTLTSGALTNAGTVNVRNNGGTVNTRTFSGDLVNDAAFDVRDGVTLTLGKTSGVHTNNAAFNVEAGSTVNFGNGGIFTQAGGTLANDGTFQLLSDTFNFNGGTATGNPIQLASSTLNIGTGSTGAGSFTFTGGGGVITGDIAAAQIVTIQGISGLAASVSSTVGFSNEGTLRIDSTGNGNPLFTVTSGALNNGGSLVFADGGGVVNRDLSADIASTGAVIVAAGIHANLTKTSGTFANAGTLTVNENAILTVAGSGNRVFTNQPGGEINGTGTIDADAVGVVFTNNGTIAPGLSEGELTILGDVPFSAAAVLEIEIGGLISGSQHDVLTISGIVNLGGLLSVELTGGYTPAPIDVFTILTGATVNGAFANAPAHVPVNGGGTFDVVYGPGNVQLTNFVPEPSSAVLLLGGLAAAAVRRRKK